MTTTSRLAIVGLASLGLALNALAQDPVVGPQLRMSVDNLSRSGNETSGSASANGLEIIGGFNDYRTDGSIKSSFGVSSDGGASWAHVLVRPPAAQQSSVEGDPMACYDARTGTLFAGAMSFAGNGGIYVAKKTPGSNTFGASVMARTFSGVDKGWMCAGPIPGNANTTRLYIAYNEGIVWSDNLGSTWTAPKSLGSGIGFLPRIGPNGELYVTYWDFGFGVMFRRSMDGGATWSAAQTAATRMDQWGIANGRVPGNFRTPQLHTMAVNPVNGAISIVYFDTTNTLGTNKNLDLYLVRSTNQGSTWSAPIRLPYRPLTTVGDMIFPWAEYTREGRLNILSFDSSYTTQNDGIAHGFWDQIYVYSDDDGATWSNKFRLTPASFDSYNDGRGTTTSFMGDYSGLGFSDQQVYPVYLDTTTAQAEVYTNTVYNPIEIPSALTMFRGSLVSGGRTSLFLHEGTSAVGKKGIVANASEAPIQFETTYSDVPANPSSLKVHVWASVNTVGLEQRILLLNKNTGQWDQVDARPATTSPSNASVTVANPSDYVNGTVVKARLAYKQVGVVATNAWTATVDQDVLLAMP
ncbi:MAG: exo-alpha-sialidase [Armatimonadetes bacterium]|nr:exo-alpha-sialidase [Armatimonadota bacterium]